MSAARKPAPLTPDGHRKQLMGLLRDNARRHDLWRIFTDFVEMSAIALSNAVDIRQRAEREERYLQIVKAYNADELTRFCQALGALTMALELAQFDDVLGRVFMELELGNKWAGQFFTPYCLCQLMAMQTLGTGVQKTIERQGFVTANDPAVGGGAMPIALANVMHDMGINYQQCLHVVCQDVDLKAVHMTYVQLSLLHVPAVVIHGNTLKVEELSRWYTPAHILGGWSFKLKRQHPEADRTALEVATVAIPASAQVALFDELEAA